MIQAYGTQPRCCLTTKVMGTSNMTEFRKHNTQAFLRVGGGGYGRWILKYESKLKT